MTVTYQSSVANSTFFTFTKLLGKWRGSIYKLLYKEMLLYSLAYAIISVGYRHIMDSHQKRSFELVVLYCEKMLDQVPLSFVLGFYVTTVVTRWWNQFMTIPWPDRIMNVVTMYIRGYDENSRILRRTLMRYINLSFVLITQSISVAVKKRFPSINHLVEAGFMTEEEKFLYEDLKLNVNKHWVPITWFVRILDKASIEGKVQEGYPIKHILQEVNDFRTKTGIMWSHDWVTVPLVYTQVVTIATHVFFTACLIGRQYLDPAEHYPNHNVDLYVPFLTFIQFCFYMGWLKVAEQLINPYGEDDDDFEINWLIDRHIQVSYAGVDYLYDKVPKIEKDVFWDHDVDLPYTEASLIHKIPCYQGSTMHMIVEEDQEMIFQSNQENQPGKERKGSIMSSVRSFLNLPTIKISDESKPEKRGRYWSVDHTINLESIQVPKSWSKRSNYESCSDQNIKDLRMDQSTGMPAKRKFGTSNNSGIETLSESDSLSPYTHGSSQRSSARNSRQESKMLLRQLTENDDESEDLEYNK